MQGLSFELKALSRREMRPCLNLQELLSALGQWMKHNHRLCVLGLCYLFILKNAHAQTDWPIFGHDPGGMRYSPLKQINTSNVDQLRVSWQFDTTIENAEPATAPITPHASPAPEASSEAHSPASSQPAATPARRPPARLAE